VKRTTEPPGGKTPDDASKIAPKRDKTAEARVEDREKRFRAFQSGLRAIA